MLIIVIQRNSFDVKIEIDSFDFDIQDNLPGLTRSDFWDGWSPGEAR